MRLSVRSASRSLAVLAALAGVAALVTPATVASASSAFHLKLVKSDPAKNDTVASARVIKLWFSEPATVAVTSIKLKAANGREVSMGRVRFAGNIQQPVEAPIADSLVKGTYTVTYKTASRDMHPVSGEYSFVVR